ncbi:MAG: radical SAM protein, partial [Spirochaetaceae bacterium]
MLEKHLLSVLTQAEFFIQHCGWPTIRSVYIGGGTPSVMQADQLHDFLYRLAKTLRSPSSIEWTIEANPEDLSPQWLSAIKDSPVSRLSLGVQSFSDKLLAVLNRRSSSASLHKAIDMVASQWDMTYCNLDFISGIPGQTAKQIASDLQQIRHYLPGHISHYTLTVEEGTSLHSGIQRGKLKLPDQDECWEQMHDGLLESGYEHYEISNYTRDQRYSEHNYAYWTMQAYIGLGDGAVGT